jgi:putative hemolysin
MRVQTPTRAAAIRPFSLPLPPSAGPLRRALSRAALPLLERALALSRLNTLYGQMASREAGDPRPFEERALGTLGISWDVPEADVARVPARGPLLVVANHPFGGVDGLLLLALLRRVRPDVKLLGNHLLRSIPELRDRLLYVDPFGGVSAAARNPAALREAIRWVRGGGALAVFPAGEVSHASFRRPRVADGPWSPAVGRLAVLCGAPALALYFSGRNRLLFQIAGLIHPRLRTALLPREMLRPRRVSVCVGHLVAPERLAALRDPGEVASYLRARAHILRGRAETPRVAAAGPAQAAEPVIAAVPAAALAREVAALPAGAELARSGSFRVLHARAGDVPSILREIGRLREIAFRAAGEGTGRSIDTDRFDAAYLHLFVWNDATREIVGAYRMGPTDEILPRDGVPGLYTSTLFRYREELLRQIGPALELGRSFVRVEYQRHPSALALLWKGIGRFVVAHPRYRHLFGPVSISSVYRSMSRSLLLSFLKMHRHVGDLGRLIRPRHTRRLARLEDAEAGLAGTVVRDLESVDELVRDIEADRLAMPVLLRQYLRLNGVLLGFTVDPDFGDVLDGLILVDLARVDRHILTRYMGADGLASFLAHHGVGSI